MNREITKNKISEKGILEPVIYTYYVDSTVMPKIKGKDREKLLKAVFTMLTLPWGHTFYVESMVRDKMVGDKIDFQFMLMDIGAKLPTYFNTHKGFVKTQSQFSFSF